MTFVKSVYSLVVYVCVRVFVFVYMLNASLVPVRATTTLEQIILDRECTAHIYQISCMYCVCVWVSILHYAHVEGRCLTLIHIQLYLQNSGMLMC